MKKSGYKSIVLLYGVMLVTSIVVILVGIGLLFSIIISTDPNGNRVLSNWPVNYTNHFVGYFEYENDMPTVNEAGIQSLDDNLLWLQIIDKRGDEAFAHNTAKTQRTHYSPIEFLELYQGGENGQYTVYAGTTQNNSEKWTYIIGFPMNIKKVTMYLDGASFTGGKSIILILLSVTALLMIVCGGIFGVWITKHMRKMIQAVGQISFRLYEPIYSKGLFQDVYDSLNGMNKELLASDEERTRNEVQREEWITNITHDLKTPLSPIKGYAELLADPEYNVPKTNRIKYGHTILRNAEYAEKLVNDLKLTYQLKNNMLPPDMKDASLSRFLKEMIIEILNYPEYSDRNIVFTEANSEIIYCFDETLLKRALNNLIYNALIHNPADTEIHVDLQAGNKISITIEDNGNGMSAEEVDKLFQRYYRGTNTEEKAEGTGLGMAIAKQIIEIHDGEIHVESQKNAGTMITITFPVSN